MKQFVQNACYMAILLSCASFNVMADEMDDMDSMDDVTIRVIDEHSNNSAKILTLPEHAADKAVTRADSREGYGLSKARDMRMQHGNQHASDDADSGAMQNSEHMSVDGLAEAIEVANEHAREALQNAMEARESHNDAKAEHGNSGMAKGQHKPVK
jgi:hypothetical protein